MKYFTLFLILIQYQFSYGQYSDRFVNLTKDLKHNDSSYFENQYSNGSIKSKGAYLHYNMPEYEYSKKTSLWIEYYNNGEIKSESVYDNLGNLLSKLLYDLKGFISSEIEAIFVDSNISNSKDYFLRNDDISIKFKVKNYKYSIAIGEVYLREMGMSEGGKRIGLWKIYDQRGRLEREVGYNNK